MNYDIEYIEKNAKRSAFCSALWLAFGILLLVFSAVSIFIKGKNPLWFIIGAICSVFALVILFKRKNINIKYEKTYFGKIEKIDLKVGASNGILTVGYGGLVRKRYSKYFRDINRVILYIRTNEEIKYLELSDVSKKLEGYYNVGDEVIHIGGTHFPVILKNFESWLCPVCGQFNKTVDKTCKHCKSSVLK